MREVSDRHERTLLSILTAVNAPLSLTDLANISGLQKTTVSSILGNAAFWGKVSTWTDGTDSQTFFQAPSPPISSEPPVLAVKYRPPVESYCQLVGEYKLLNILHQGY